MLIGISLGPGDPELITIKAQKTLKQADKVYVPGERARDLVKPYCQPETLKFPMTSDQEVLQKYWNKHVEKIAPIAREKKVAFAVLGDVNFFSTFGHIKRIFEEKHPDIQIKTIPGVSAITAMASKMDVFIDKSFQVTDGSQQQSKIIMKATELNQQINALEKEGYNEFILGKELYTENEEITTKIPEESPYFSILLARKNPEKNPEEQK
ncbi:cobalt-factor II C(20)-methyltransferase [Methanonatronarchaeum sp. AMET6-2]|uniref:cobalt-factor II C(20)-methyltransferase n=1 Tax=Methanonatronarchaeum sp. AMET6-2 TaxID=2933293 RepID=UPI00120B7F41|nr:cobalt-factor II C(20)-methyltransferase [Methanonatronarchaeum sp. AMET6-2]RZN63421.1 MAG: cobalt-factor II C(20)-methyltransferase [Methanonatronarchaeia archaeon]UOY10087.1 cobalt-factor II C(20)-methyltransferase [Methanonatronarchaeum sp. AMET6-2]